MYCLPRPIQRYTKKALSGAALLRQMCSLMTTRLVLFLDNQKLDENKKERRIVKKRNLPTYIYIVYGCALHPFQRDITWDIFWTVQV